MAPGKLILPPGVSPGVYTVCPKCGAQLRDPGRDFTCGRCGSVVRTLGATFEDDNEGMGPIAAIQLSDEPRWKAILLAVQSMARLVAMVLLLVVLLLCIAALVLGAPSVFAGAIGSGIGAPIYLLAPAPVTFFILTDMTFLAYFTFLVVAILGSFAYLVWHERRDLLRQVSTSVKEFTAPPRKEAFGFNQVPQLFLAVLFFDLLYAWALMFSGTQTRSPDFASLPDWYLYYTFANASVYEELAARTLLCGMPLLLAYTFAFLTSNGSTYKEYLSSKCSRGLKGFLIGGGFKVGPLEAFFLAGSALMFGFAHAPGWDLWKVMPTFVAGLAFGYLFLRVGIHAAIILHFAFDYLSLAYSLVPGILELEVLLIFVWFIVGGFYYFHYIWQIFTWVMQKLSQLSGPGPATSTATPISPLKPSPVSAGTTATSSLTVDAGRPPAKRDDLVDVEGSARLLKGECLKPALARMESGAAPGSPTSSEPKAPPKPATPPEPKAPQIPTTAKTEAKPLGEPSKPAQPAPAELKSPTPGDPKKN